MKWDQLLRCDTITFTATDDEIVHLDQHGVKALRFNVKRGGSEDISKLDYFARRVYELAGWHSEIYIDAKHLLTSHQRLNSCRPFPLII